MGQHVIGIAAWGARCVPTASFLEGLAPSLANLAELVA